MWFVGLARCLTCAARRLMIWRLEYVERIKCPCCATRGMDLVGPQLPAMTVPRAGYAAAATDCDDQQWRQVALKES